MSFVHYFSVWREPGGFVAIENPPLEEVVKAVREIGLGRVFNVVLYEDCSAPNSGAFVFEHCLKIFGEKDLYHITEWNFGDEVRGYKNTQVHPSKKVNIKGYQYPYQLRQFCTDIDFVVEIVKEFSVAGSLSKKAEWW